MSGRRVLVTRPQPGAGRTARHLSAAGFQPLVLPLTRTMALQPAAMPDPARFDLVAATSANAVTHAPAGLVAKLRALPFHAVGERTAEAARQAGFAVVASDAGNAQRLAAAIVRQHAPCRVLFLCGRVRRPDLETALAQAGFACEPVETYDTQSIAYSDDEIGEAIGWNPVWGAVVYSAGGAERLSALTVRARLAEFFHETRFFCLSAGIAAALGGAAAERSTVAAEADETALMGLLRRA